MLSLLYVRCACEVSESATGGTTSEEAAAEVKSVMATDASVEEDANERSVSPANEATDPAHMFDEEKMKWAKQTANELCLAGLTPTQPGIEYLLSSCPADVQLKYCRLDALLDRIVSKDVKISKNMANRCERYIAAGEDTSKFYELVGQYDINRVCGKLLYDASDPTQYIMYRCSTCSLNEGMALCSSCFENGNHTSQDHEFSAFDYRTATDDDAINGTCDCGDATAMKPDGFCPRHGRESAGTVGPPTALLSLAEFVVPKIMFRILLHNRKYRTERGKLESNQLLSVLKKLSRLGSVAHDLLTRAFTNQQLYEKFNTDKSHGASRTKLQIAIASLDCIVDKTIAQRFECPSDLGIGLHHYSCLDEMTFWLVQAKCPKDFALLFMNILPNATFKYEFFRCFVRHYSRIGEQAVRSKDTGTHNWAEISCQFCYSEGLVSRLMVEQKMHMIMLTTVFALVHASLTQCIAGGWCHLVVQPKLCSRWSTMINDLRHALSAKPVAIQFLNDTNAIKCWTCILVHFQALVVNRRQLDEHVEMEREEYRDGAVAEIRLWKCLGGSLALAIDRVELAPSLHAIMRTTNDLLQQMWQRRPGSFWKPDPYEFTLHLPLHRNLATFLLRANQLGISCPVSSECFLRRSVMGPLSIQVARAEIGANMWVRNGLTMKHHIELYIGVKCFVDIDTYWIQHCACNINTHWLMLTIIERFHLADWLDFCNKKPEKPFLEAEWVRPMVEGALKTIAFIATPMTNLDMDACRHLRQEVSALLCRKDREYNRVNVLLQADDDLMTKLYNTAMLEDVLKELAEYTEAHLLPTGRMSAGVYAPNMNLWANDFDPLFCMYRYNSSGYQSAMDRYTSFVEKKMKESVQGGVSKDTLWPPFRIPKYPTGDLSRLQRLLQNRVLHAFIWNVLYKWWMQASSVTESAVQICINLLELALTTCEPMAYAKDEIIDENVAVLNLYLSTWFKHDCILHNLCRSINQIVVFNDGPVDTQPSAIPDLEAMQMTTNNESNLVRKCAAADCLKVYTIDTKDALTVNWDAPLGQVTSDAGHETEEEIKKLTEPEPNIELMSTGGHTLLSLLLNLHDRMAGNVSAYYTPAPLPYTPPTSRLGTGCLFISNILNLAFSKSARCNSAISAFCLDRDAKLADAKAATQVAKPDEAFKPASSDETKKTEARKKARAELMEKYKSKQKQSIAKHESASQEPATSDSPSAPRMQQATDVTCAICSQSSPVNIFLTEQRFIGLPVRYRPTTILGLSESTGETSNLMDMLPEPKSRMDVLYDRRTYHFLKYLQSLAEVFTQVSCIGSVSSSWYSSIRVDSCAHYIHSDCLQHYLKTKPEGAEAGVVLSADQFQCPVCRRVYSELMPMLPHSNSNVDHMNQADPVHAYLSQDLQQIDNRHLFPRWFHDELLSFYRRIRHEYHAFPEFTEVFTPADSCGVSNTVLLFDSILRTKLELDSFKSGSSSEKNQIFSASLLSLMSVGKRLIFYDKDVAILRGVLQQSWKLLQGQRTALAVVPLLLQDPLALLLQFTQYLHLCMAPPAAHELVECCVRRLAALQTVVRYHFSDPKNWDTVKYGRRWSVDAMLGACKTIRKQTCAAKFITPSTNTWELSEPMVKELDAYCRIVKEWSKVVGCSVATHVHAETAALMEGDWSDAHKRIAHAHIEHLMQCITEHGHRITAHFSTNRSEGIKCMQKTENRWKTFLQLPNLGWDRPRLVRLPRKFHSLYVRYSALPCFACTQIPLEPHICLLCAQTTRCCADNEHGILEHANKYHAGFCVYLNVTRHCVRVVSGGVAVLWGHVYVDKHGQEPDEDRTRPLILCDKRFELLEKNWIEGI